ncbi:MAG: M48 family metallopeptidase [Pseudomonadota bacterium]
MFFPTGSSRRAPARLVSRAPVADEADGPEDWVLDLLADDGSVAASAPLSALVVDPQLGSTARRMTFPDGTMFETNDHSGVEALVGRDRWSILHGLEQFHPRLIAITIAALVGMFLVYRFALEYLVVAAIALTPGPVIEQLDRGTMQTLDFTVTDPTELTPARQDEVRAVFANVVAALPADQAERHSFELLFRDAPRMGPNAFALPGGTIVFTDQFVETFPDADMIAGVMGHEIGHVIDQHGLQQFYRALGLYFLITMLAGETGPLMEDVLLEGNALLSLSYSRRHEREADEFGLRLAHAAGYDPFALRAFFVELSTLTGDRPEFLSTHPSSSDRADEIERFIEDELGLR